MPRKSVGDVLRKAHGWLRLGGTLVNLQPIRQTIAVEVHSAAERRRSAGLIRDDAETYEDIRSSERALSGLAAQGFFLPRAHGVYLLEFHFPTPDDWRQFLARPRTGSAEVDELMLAAAWEDPTVRVVAVDETGIATYERAIPADQPR